MNHDKDANGSGPRLDMTPMIDVVFLLLIFFVVVTKQDDILSALSAARPAPSVKGGPDIELISIDITSSGFAFNGVVVSGNELDGRLEKYSRISTDAMVAVKCTLDSPHGLLIQSLDMCNKHGMKNVSVFSRR